jgi:hypothetical protein
MQAKRETIMSRREAGETIISLCLVIVLLLLQNADIALSSSDSTGHRM